MKHYGIINCVLQRFRVMIMGFSIYVKSSEVGVPFFVDPALVLPFFKDKRASASNFWFTPHKFGMCFSHLRWQFTLHTAPK